MHEAQEPLRRAGAESREITALVESAGIALVLLDTDTRLKVFTPRAGALLKLRAEDLDRPFCDLALPFDCPELPSLVQVVGNSLVCHETIVTTRGGRSYLVRLCPCYSAGAPTGGVVIHVEEFTGYKTAAEARYLRLFETSRDGIAIIDAENHVFVDVNPAVERMSGYKREELVGRTVWEIDPHLDTPEFHANLMRVGEEGAVWLHEAELWARDGRRVPVEVVANPCSEPGRSYIQFNIRDISERKKFEAGLLHAQKLESLGLLAGGIAHDFNNLLTGILGNASMVSASTPIDSPLRPALRDIMRAAERAAYLTRQMLAYAGKGRFVVQRLDIAELIREIGALIRTSIPKSIEVSLDVASGLPPVDADAGQMQQLIMNLAVNGAEAIGEDRPGRLEIRAAECQISGAEALTTFSNDRIRPGSYVRILIHDNGSGMDESTRVRMFDPFFTTKFTGRGLGLAAVMGIVKGHNGAIRVTSAPGKGTAVEVLLPAVDRPVPAPAGETLPCRVTRGSGVLVIDDEEIVRKIAGEVLEGAGFRVLTAENGRTGVEVFGESHENLSVVLLDLLMPGMGGEETLERLQAIDAGVPVILSSGFDENEAACHFRGKHLAGFLQKPYDIQRLFDAICTALSDKRGQE